MFTFIFSINISALFNYIFSTLFFYVTFTSFAFLFNFNSITSIFVNKLIIDSITQKIWLLNALNANVKIELKRTFNHYTKFRLIKNFLMNSLIDLIVLFNYNSIVIKAILTLFVKAFFTNFRNYIKKRWLMRNTK